MRVDAAQLAGGRFWEASDIAYGILEGVPVMEVGSSVGRVFQKIPYTTRTLILILSSVDTV